MNCEKNRFEKSIYNKSSFKEFCKLKVDMTVKSIDENDLPQEFSNGLCEFIDLFRRKTVNENREWNFYIDYETDEIIHCIYGDTTTSKGWINSGLMKNRKIMTLHNHPQGTYSAPSSKNFEILDFTFEDYEIVCAEQEYWILESKNECENIEIIKDDIEKIFISCNFSNQKDKNKLYSQRLTKYINNLNQEISLTKKEYS